MQANFNYETISILLPAIIDVQVIEAITDRIKHLSVHKQIIFTLDASKVENVTTPALQLIVSLANLLSISSSSLIIKNGSDSFVKSLKDAGLESFLYKPVAGSGN